jgi:hypothetical protein
LQQSESLVGRAKVVNVKQAGAAGKKSARNKNKSTAHYLDDAAAPYLPLPAGTINIKRMVNANISEPSKQKITGAFSAGKISRALSYSSSLLSPC